MVGTNNVQGARLQIIRSLSPEHWFAGLAALAALFMLRSSTPASVKEGPLAMGAALVLTLPVGWAFVTWLLPSITSLSIRAALIALVGYVGTTMLGFFLDVLGLHKLYAPVCLLLLLAWLAHGLRALARDQASQGSMAAKLRAGAAQILANRNLWVVVGISCLSICAVTPVLAPLVKITPDLSVDYSFTDNYYHLIRAYELSFGAPLRIWPDLSGVMPLVYPDFHNFWVGQIIHYSGADATAVFYIYAPVLMVLSAVLLMYAVGRSITGSRWGGYLAACLPYLVVLPNAYDPNLFFKDNIDTWPIWTAARLQFLEFRSNMAYGAAWQLLGAIVLVLVAYRLCRDDRSQIGLLTLGGVFAVALLRIRSHFFVIVAPLYGLILLGVLVRRRRIGFLVPGVVFAGVFGVIYLESTAPYYNAGTSQLGLAYGPFGQIVSAWLPEFIRPLITRLPVALQPLVNVGAFELLQMVGAFYGLLLLITLVQALRRRRRLELHDWFLIGTMVLTFPAALLIVLEAWSDSSGNWGGQVSFLLHGAAMLLAILPLYNLLRWLARRFELTGQPLARVGLGMVLALTTVSYRAASATLHNQTGRGYPITQQELDAYYWIQHNTLTTAVLATNPDYPVTYGGQTMADTAFLSGVTLRPAYLQFVGPFYPQEVQARRQLLEQLYRTTSPAEARALIQAATFNYLLVYADMQPALDLTCCLLLVHDGNPQIYQVPTLAVAGPGGHPPTPAQAVVQRN